MYECMCGKINYMMFILVRLVEKDNDRVIGLQILLSVFAVSPLARRANTRALDYLLSKVMEKIPFNTAFETRSCQRLALIIFLVATSFRARDVSQPNN